MNKENNLTLAMAVVVMLVVGCAYIHSVKSSFTLNDDTFEQAGVMEYRDNGNTLYLPVFKRK